MERGKFIPIGEHGIHVSKRDEHLIKAGLAAAEAIAGGIANNPAVSAALGSAALYEVAKAVDHHEERLNGR